MTAPAGSPRSRTDEPDQPPTGATSDPAHPTPAPASPDSLRIRPLDVADTPATARLHCDNLHTGLFPRLGPRFVARWHRTFTSCQHGRGAVVVDDTGTVTGFVLVATDSRSYVAEVINQAWLSLAFHATASLLCRPPVMVYFLRTRAVRYWRRLLPRTRARRQDPPVVAPAPTAVVHALVVTASAQGRGSGKRLLQAAEQTARRAGAEQIALVTTAVPSTEHASPGAVAGRRETGAGAEGFYEHLGWRRGQVRTRDGRAVVGYSRPLT